MEIKKIVGTLRNFQRGFDASKINKIRRALRQRSKVLVFYSCNKSKNLLKLLIKTFKQTV